MATWIAHMRIAEYFMRKHDLLRNAEFLVGSIGPDCGVPNEDWSSFTPDKHVTHWWSKDDTFIDAEDYKDRYLNKTDARHAFYLGYYFHLLTDIEWSKLFDRKKAEPLYAEGLRQDARFIWKIKKDWYGQDHLFLQTNNESVFFSVFSKIQAFPNVYFDFYPPDAFIRQVRYITDFYLRAKEDPDRAFPYLSKEEMDSFVEETILMIERFHLPDAMPQH